MLPPNVQLAPGSSDSANVKKLQDYLVSQGLMTQQQVNTGYGTYGPATTAAVQALQQRLGINATSTGAGVYGPQTSQMAVVWAQGPTQPPAGSTPTNVQPTTPPPTQSQPQQPAYNPAQNWNLSSWNSSGNQFTNKPVLTVDGRQLTFNTPQEYIAVLQQIKQLGGDTNGNIDRFIGEFNNVVPNFTASTPTVTTPAQQTPAPTQTPTPTPTPSQPVTVTSTTPTSTTTPNYNMGTINVNGNQVVSTIPTNSTTPTPVTPQPTTPTTPVTTPTTTTQPATTTPQVIPEGSYNLGNGEYLTKEEFDALDKKYYDEQTPFYEAQKNFDISNYDTDEQSILNSYDLTKRDYEARAREDFDALNDNEGQKGTWASSERIKRRNNLQDKYNRSYESLYNTNYDNLYKNRLERAYNYGDTNVGANTPLQKYTNTFGDSNITTSSTGSGATYNPFGFQGRKNIERKNNSRLAAIDQLNTFTYNTKYNQ